ncbi:MAG: carboxypeptidase-like regulatory domain-containing protein, partial [Bacteroidota bacterium]
MSLRAILFHCVFLFFCLNALEAQNQIIITDDDLQGGNAYTWTSANEYLLDGLVYLEAGGVLTIEPGTVIRGRNSANISNGDFNSALIISRGAQIFAEGTSTQPIIFTAEDDDLLDPADFFPTDVGEWGGLLLLGNATIARPEGLSNIEGINISDERAAYGGTDDTDNSGTLRFVSIRHAGGTLSPDNEINALTLAGVGSGTTIDYVEVYAALDDGFEFFGGTVNAYHLVSAYCQDDAFDIDQGYRGIGQFWLGLAAGRRLLEIDGASPDPQPPFSQPNLVNLTLVGGPVDPFSTGEPGEILFRDNSGGHLRNSVVVNALPQGVVIEDRDDTSTDDAYARFIAGDLTITNNYFNNEGGLTDWTTFSQLINQSEEIVPLTTLSSYLDTNNELTDTPVIRSSNTDNSMLFDPLPRQGSSILTGGSSLMEPGLATVGYQGAFGENDNWLDWTFLKSSPSDFQIISGRISQSANCTYNASDAPAAGVIVRLETDGAFRFTTTDANGEYATFVPTGTTSVTALAPGTAWLPCTSSPGTLAATWNPAARQPGLKTKSRTHMAIENPPA